MFNIERKTYIIKNASGRISKIAFTSNASICISSLRREKTWFEPSLSALKSKGGYWTEESVICRDVHPDFSACIDEGDNIHILCQNKSNKIIYIRLTKNMIKTTEAIADESGIPDRHPVIFKANGKLMLFYIAGKSPERNIVFQTQESGGILTRPVILDNAAYMKTPYFITSGSSNCPYLFYKKKGDENILLGYKKYNEGTGLWDDFNTVFVGAGQNEILSAAVDYQDNIYMVRQTSGSAKYGIICSVRRRDSEKWTDSTIPVFGANPLYNSSILAMEDHIIIWIVKENSIYYSLSIDKGHTWGDTEAYYFNDASPLLCISYMSNMKGEYSNTFFNPLPGKITGGFHLAFLNDFCSRPENMAIDDLKELIHYSLKQNSLELDTLKKSIGIFETKIDHIDMRLRILEEKLLSEPENKKTGNSASDGIGIKASSCDEMFKPVSRPLMVGSGFSGVTEEYLKGTGKRKKKPETGQD